VTDGIGVLGDVATFYQTWSYPTISKWFQAVGVVATAFEMNQHDNPREQTWGFSYVQQRPVDLTVVTTLTIGVRQVHATQPMRTDEMLWQVLQSVERRSKLPLILANAVQPRAKLIDLCVKITSPEAALWDRYKHELRHELNALVPPGERKHGAAKELITRGYLQNLLIRIRDEFYDPPLREAQIITSMLVGPPQDWSAWNVLGEVV